MDVPQGAFFDLSVDPGATLPHNAKITVTLSQGPKPVTMPGVVGKSKDEAQQTLDALKLTVNWTEQFDDKIRQGQVISASAKTGDELHWGDSVNAVSKGPGNRNAAQSCSATPAAKAALEKLGFS